MSSSTSTPASITQLPTFVADFGAAAAAATEHDAASNALVAAEAEILAHVIQLARPALRHVAKEIDEDWTGEQTDGMRGYDRSTPFPQRGIVLAGDLERRLGGRDDTRGAIEGEALVLWADGSLSVVNTTGTWTRWARECPTKSRTAIPVTPSDALADWELEPCLEALAAALSEAATNRLRRGAATAERRAQRLREVLTALQ